MKKQKIIEEVYYYLTDETRADKRLNPIDLNVLAILQYVANQKVPQYNKDGWFIIPLGKNKKIKSTSLEQYMEEFEVPTIYRTIQRSVSKLSILGYIDYKQGFWNIETKKGCLPEIKILRGTICDFHEIVGDTSNACVSDDCVEMTSDEKISDCDTANYSGIVITTDTDTYSYTNTDTYTNSNLIKKEKIKETYITENKKEKDILEAYFAERTTRCSWQSFVNANPSVYSLNVPLDNIKNYFENIKC